MFFEKTPNDYSLSLVDLRALRERIDDHLQYVSYYNLGVDESLIQGYKNLAMAAQVLCDVIEKRASDESRGS